MRTAQPFLFAGLLTLAASTCLTASWLHATGLSGQRVNALAVDGTQIFAATQDSGVFLSRDSGTSWLAINAGLTSLHIRALAMRGTYLFAGAQDNGMFRSSDRGATWHAINVGISSTNIQALAANDSFLFAGTSGGGVCRSADSGSTWQEVNKLDDGTDLHFKNIFSFGVCSAYVFIGTWGGSAFRSADNGTTWYMVTNGMADPRENEIPYAFAVGGPYIFAGTAGGGVLRAQDSARVWFPVNAGLPDSALITALVLTGDSLFAATQRGVFLSRDNGNQWTLATDGLGDTAVITFAVGGGNLLAGTSNGIWRLPLGEPSVAGQRRVADARTSDAHLMRSSLSTVAYTTGTSGGTVLIYGPSGKVVFSQKVYGTGTVTWVSPNRSAGVYFATLSVGARVLTMPMALRN